MVGMCWEWYVVFVWLIGEVWEDLGNLIDGGCFVIVVVGKKKLDWFGVGWMIWCN